MNAQTIKQIRILLEALHKLEVPEMALANVKRWVDKEEKKLEV